MTRVKWRGMGRLIALALALAFAMRPMQARAEREEKRQEGESGVYDSLRDSMEKNWKGGFEDLEAQDEIEVKGPLAERALRSIANVFYKHLLSIKAWSLLLGVISFVVGCFIAVTANLNKRLRRFAISLLVVTIPALLIVFTFGITKLVSMFI